MAAAARQSRARYVCLCSEADVETYPNNRPEEFVNLLPAPLRNRENHRFYLRLQSVGLSLGGEGPTMTKSYLKIHIYELDSQRQGSGYSHCAGAFAYPPKNRHRPFYALHDFQETPDLLIRFQELNRLHVRITDENDGPIRLPRSWSTIVWVKITDMAPHDQFTVLCTSHQPRTFPGNTLVKFASPLPSEMDLQGYEVALQQLVFPPHMTEPSVGTLKVGRATWEFDFSDHYDITSLIREVGRRIAASNYADDLVFNQQMDRQINHYGQMYFARSNGQTAHLRGPVTIVPSNIFTRVCGQLMRPKAAFNLDAGETEFFEGEPSVRHGTAHPVALLECDVVTPNARQSHLLHCVPVLTEQSARSNRMYEPARLAFHRVQEVPIARIAFAFRSPDGELRRFEPGSPVDFMLITLLFRRVR
jgi:hypothetical protein